MRKAKLIIVLLTLSFTLTLNLTAEAATDEWITRTLDEDLFFAAYRFDGVDMVYLQGDNAQIVSWLWFEGPVVQAGRYIKEAYLSVKIASVGGTDPDASMTIYGKPAKQGGNPSYYDDPSAINGPYTVNSYTVNLSSFVDAGAWHNITVTNILREINQGYYHYDGHDVAFVTLSPSGHDEERTITSEESGNAAKLYIHYGEPDYPPGLPPGGSVVEEYRNYTIWEFSPPEVNVTDMTQTGNLGKLHVFNETTFNWTDINKSTSNVALGYLVNMTGPDSVDGFEIDFNFTVHVDIAHASQKDALAFWVGSEDPVIGSINDIITGNELILMDLYTVDLNYYRFLPRSYGTDGSLMGGYSGNLHDDHWYSGTVILDGTLWRMEITEMDGTPKTSCQMTLVHTKDIYAIMPVSAKESVAGSQVDGWMTLDVEASTYFVTDENGTVIPTWNGDNFTDIDDLKDFIDEDVIGYPDPEDPNPPGWDEDSWLSAHRFKLILFIVGMILFIGSPIYGFAERPEAATWIVIMMNMIVGVALLWSLQTM